jgi:hypothetical protein
MIGFFHYHPSWAPHENSFCTGPGLIMSRPAFLNIAKALISKKCSLKKFYDTTLTHCAKVAKVVIIHSSLFKPFRAQSPSKVVLAEKFDLIGFHQLSGHEIVMLNNRFQQRKKLISPIMSGFRHNNSASRSILARN